MSTNVVLNNVTYAIPSLGDSNWGDNVSNYLIAVASACLQKSAGAFTLTAELDFGATYGLKSPYFKSRATNPSSTGIVRLGNTEVIAWRNAGNSADLGLTVNASNALQFNGTSLLLSGAIVNADIAALAAIDLSKLAAVTASQVLVSDASGFVSASSTSATTLSYLDVSSSLTTLLSGKEPTITTLSIAKGGTNSGTALNNNRVMQSSGSAIVEAAAITASRVLISDANGIPTHSSVTSTTLGFLDATSSIQTQLNGKQASGSYAVTTGKLNQFAATSSAELAGVISDETGSGALVFGTSPSLTAPSFSSITNTGTLTLPTSTDTLLGRATSDTLTNKTFGDSIVTTQISKPSSPSSGYNKLYTKTDNKLYVLDSSGNEKSAGGVSVWAASTAYAVNDMVIYSKYTYIAVSAHTSGSSMEADLAAGGKWVKLNLETNNQENLMTYGFNFEDNDVGGWTATGCATVTNGLPVSVGSGGSAFSSSNGGRAKGANTTDPAIVSSGVLNGQYSLNFATSGAGTIGDGYISGLYPISIKYQAKVLQLSFSYKVVTGSPNLSGSSSNTYAAAVYDPVNNSWLGLAGAFNFVQGTGVGTFTGTFQTASNTTGLQIFIYSPVAPVAASALYLDDFYIGPQVSSSGAAMSDTVSYTPSVTNLGTGSGTATGYYRREGDQLHGFIKFVKDANAGTGSSTVFFSLPSGLSIDSTKLNPGLQQTIGSVWAFGIKGSNTEQISVASYSGNLILVMNPGDTSGNALFGSNISANSLITIEYRVPIVGWSSNTVQSADSDQRVVAAKYYASAISATTVANSSTTELSGTYITTFVQVFDTTGSFNTSTGRYTCPSTGFYKITAQAILATASYPAGTEIDLLLYKNGVSQSGQYNLDTRTIAATITTYQALNGSTYIQCNAGETLSIGVFQNRGGTVTLSAPVSMSFEKITGPAVVQASESITMRAYTTNAQAITTGGSAVITTLTKVFDSHGMLNTTTGVYTIPRTGKYKISFNLASTSAAWTTGSNRFYRGVISGTQTVLFQLNTIWSSMTTYIGVTGSTTLNYNQGDTVSISWDNNTGSTITLGGSSADNWFTIESVGN